MGTLGSLHRRLDRWMAIWPPRRKRLLLAFILLFATLTVLFCLPVRLSTLFSGSQPLQCSTFDVADVTEKYTFPVCFVTRVHNYAEWLPEWIEYHAELGVSRFFIGNDCSTDNDETDALLRYYQSEGIVQYYPHIPKNECGEKRKPNEKMIVKYLVNEAKHAGCDWIGVIDADEFVTFTRQDLQSTTSLASVLERFPFPLIKLAWWVVGSNGYETKQNGLQLENYRKGSYRFNNAKTIARSSVIAEWRQIEQPVMKFQCLTELAMETYPTTPQLEELTSEDGKKTTVTKLPIMIKHFMYRSYEEYARGRGALKKTSNNEANPWRGNRAAWDEGNLYKDTFDPSATFTDSMAQKVRARLNKRSLPPSSHRLVL